MLAACYDRVALVKGPSFGARFSVLCPFAYLAHYGLVTSRAGRARLYGSGLNPYLIRVSVGCEEPADIARALREGLRAAADEVQRQRAEDSAAVV